VTVKIQHVLTIVFLGAAVASVAGARRAASGASVSPEAVAFHGATELYRTLAVFFGNQALRAEARYWEAVRHG
jgi:hypothetical protein